MQGRFPSLARSDGVSSPGFENGSANSSIRFQKTLIDAGSHLSTRFFFIDGKVLSHWNDHGFPQNRRIAAVNGNGVSINAAGVLGNWRSLTGLTRRLTSKNGILGIRWTGSCILNSTVRPRRSVRSNAADAKSCYKKKKDGKKRLRFQRRETSAAIRFRRTADGIEQSVSRFLDAD